MALFNNKKSGAQIDEFELKAILANEIRQALGADGGKLSEQRQLALRYYEGQPFGNEQEGRSQVVSRNVLEAVEWVLPALLRIFTAGDQICEFEPYQPGHEAMAEQATQYVNFIINKDNPGFILLHDWFKDCLISKMGYIKIYWDERRTYTTSIFTGLNDDEYHAITGSEDVEIMEEAAYPNPDPNLQWFTQDSPQPQAPQLHDIKLRVWQTQGRVKIENLAPEEVLVSRRAPTTVLDGRHFVCHRSMKTVSDLVEMGFDQELIDRAMGGDEFEFNSERINRFDADEDFPFSDNSPSSPALRQIYVEESYLPIDYDGDGIAELRKIVSANSGSIIFSNEPIDECPIISLCPIPMPHKHVGMSLADLVSDLQEIKSTLWRQMLDSLYLSIAPRMMVDENALSESSYDDLLTVRPGGIIRLNNIQGVQPLEVPFVGQAAMPMMQYLDETQEVRTGVSRQNQTISVDDLNKHASGAAIGMAQQAAAQRVELIARIFAETGIKMMAQKVLGLVVRHQQEARVIRLTGNWIPMDPRGWRESMDVSVSVGLGSGNRDQMLGHLSQVLQIQNTIVEQQGGVTGPLVTAENIYSVLKKLTENAGFKEGFFTDPAKSPQQQSQQKPDPEMVKAQAQAQAQAAKTQADMQIQKTQAEFTMQLENLRFQHEAQLEQSKAQHQMEIEKSREQNKQVLEQARLQGKMMQEANANTANDNSPVPGSRMAPDGRHYIPDPNRPGKYMMVV